MLYPYAQDNNRFTTGFSETISSKVLCENRKSLYTKQFKKGESLFKLNIANNPNSGNCYDSIGDLYLAMGNKTKAVASFNKALTLSKIPETRAKLRSYEKIELAMNHRLNIPDHYFTDSW